LLAHDFPEGRSTVCGPAQGEFLSTLGGGFHELDTDAPKPLRLVEQDAESLWPGAAGPPSRPIAGK
jgi:hypothetical protein